MKICKQLLLLLFEAIPSSQSKMMATFGSPLDACKTEWCAASLGMPLVEWMHNFLLLCSFGGPFTGSQFMFIKYFFYC